MLYVCEIGTFQFTCENAHYISDVNFHMHMKFKFHIFFRKWFVCENYMKLFRIGIYYFLCA
jgi:hypothetical protein